MNIIKILQVIWTVIKSKYFAYAVVGIITLFAFGQCNSKQDEIAKRTKADQNLVAMNDTAKFYKDKYGNSVTEKSILIMTEKELKKKNKELYDKVQQQSGNIISLNTTLIQLKQDTTMLRNKLKGMGGVTTAIDSTTFRTDWELVYDWDKQNYDIYKGSTYNKILSVNPLKVEHQKTELTFRQSQIDLTFGEKVVDGKYKVFIQSAYPGLTQKSLEGIFIDPNTNKDIKKLIKKQHWFTGFSVGISVTPGYDLLGNKFGITVGPSLTWNMFQW